MENHYVSQMVRSRRKSKLSRSIQEEIIMISVKNLLAGEKKCAKLQIQEEAIPPDILDKMLNVLQNPSADMKAKAIEFIKKNEHEIRFMRSFAEKGLLRTYKALSDVDEENEESLKKVRQILRRLSWLKENLPESVSIEGDFSDDSLTKRLEIHFCSALDRNVGADHNSVSQDDFDYWFSFLEMLDKQIQSFKSIEKTLLSFRGKGAPNKKEMLCGYIEWIVKLYCETTGNKFTVNEYGEKSLYTEGMLFVEQAMYALHSPAFDGHSKYRNELSKYQYPESTFFNACDTVARQRRQLGKNKAKTP